MERVVGGNQKSIASVAERLRQWRRSAGGRGRRLPEWVWTAAVRLAQAHGVRAVAQALRVNQERLEQRVRAREAGPSVRGSQEASMAFVELGPVASPPTCLVEVSNASGTRLTIRLSDPAQLDFAGLSAAFFGDRR